MIESEMPKVLRGEESGGVLSAYLGLHIFDSWKAGSGGSAPPRKSVTGVSSLKLLISDDGKLEYCNRTGIIFGNKVMLKY